MMERVLAVLLAGGVGERLYPLTRDNAKPAVRFGGIYRLIDITLSNCINSGLRRVYILTQHKALSLNRHIRATWHFLPPELGEFVEVLPPMKRMRDTWYLGTADAVYQNLHSVEDEGLPYTLVLSADHVYKMNYRHMVDWHLIHKADITVGTTLVRPDDAGRFGIVSMESDFRILGFEEKPDHNHASRSRFSPEACSASMGIYVFSTEVLLRTLHEDAKRQNSSHDFGKDILPRLIGKNRIIAYDFVDENKNEMRYWRDVGTIEAYYEANMDLVSVTPLFNLYDSEWPIRTAAPEHAPAKFVFADAERRMGVALDSLVSHGCIISGGRVVRSVLSPGVRINSYAQVEESILFDNVRIGRASKIRRAIIEANLEVPENCSIGVDPETDRKAGHFVTESGIVVLHSESPGVHVRKKLNAALPQSRPVKYQTFAS
jgi:glucose-1-phosphate adenylyltransferase